MSPRSGQMHIFIDQDVSLKEFGDIVTPTGKASDGWLVNATITIET